MPTPLALTCWSLLALLPAAPPVFDKVLLHDGRLIEGHLLASEDEDVVLLRLPGADVPIGKQLVDRTYVEDLEDYVPKNDKERENLERGWVLFEGTWMSRTRRESTLRKRAEEDRQAIIKLREEQDWRNAKRFTSRNFEVVSNARQEVVDEYVSRLELYYKEFLATWRITVSPSRKRKKMKLLLYRNEADFLAISESTPGQMGFFDWLDGELHLFHDEEHPRSSLDTLYHEGNHLLTYLIQPGFEYPPWMNEGMAEYFATAQVDDRGRFVVGAPQYGRIATMRNDEAKGRSIGLDELLNTASEDFSARHYAVAWSFNHFLMEHPGYGKAYKSFFAKLPKNRDLDVSKQSYSNVKGSITRPTLSSIQRSLEKTLKRSTAQLEQEWREHIDATYGSLDSHAYYQAAMLTLHTGDGAPDQQVVETSMDFLERAFRLGSTRPIVYREYAEMLREGGFVDLGLVVIVSEPQPEKAWQMIQRAIQLDPIDPFNYSEAAAILILDGPPQDFERARAMLDTARALAPRHLSIIELLADLESDITYAEALAGKGR